MIKVTLVCALLVLCGCSELETFEATCGNFEIDPGEDCDEGAEGTERCSQCRLACDALRTCHGFPDYSCGADGFCSAPSGKLASKFTELATLGQEVMITDVDGDLYGDLVSVSRTSLTVHYGDSEANLSLSTSSLVPTLRGAPSFADIDNDARLDVVWPTADGVAAYSSPYQSLAPHPFALDLGDPEECDTAKQLGGQPFHVFRLDEGHLAVLVSRNEPVDSIAGNNKLGVAVISTNSKSICGDVGSAKAMCNIAVGDMMGGMNGMGGSFDPLLFGYAEYDTSTATLPSKVIAFTSGLPGGGACGINFVKNAVGSFDSKEIFQNANVTKPVALADLSGTGCPALVETLGVGARAFRAGGVPGDCRIDPAWASIALPFGSFAVGSARIDPLPSGLAHTPDAIVTTDGMYVLRRSDLLDFTEIYKSDRTLTAATSTDIDSDGDLDIIAVSQGAEDVDVIQRVGSKFLLLRLDTAGSVNLFVVGDFDGNEVSDIAYTELFMDTQRLKVAYGTRDRPLEPIDVGAFRMIVGLVSTQTPDSTDPDNIIDDLIILDLVDPPTPVLTLLHGSPQRTMQSYFDPRKGNQGAGSPTVFSAVATGNFFPTEGLGPFKAPYLDMLTLDSVRIGPARVWPLLGISYGELSYTKAFETGQDLGSCDIGVAPTTLVAARFCTDSARYMTWPRAGDNDVVIGIDGPRSARHVVVLDPLDPGIGDAVPHMTVTHAAFPFAGTRLDGLDVRSLQRADLDGDGRAELIVALGPADPDPKAGAILVCSVNTGGVPEACVDLVEQIPAIAGLGCVDATVAKVRPAGPPRPPLENADPSAQPPTPQDLVIVCHDEIERGDPDADTTDQPEMTTVSGLFRVHHVGGAYQADFLTGHLGSIEVVRSGDVTGDGLDDIVGLRDNRTLIVMPQCATNDLLCTPDVVAQEEPAP